MCWATQKVWCPCEHGKMPTKGESQVCYLGKSPDPIWLKKYRVAEAFSCAGPIGEDLGIKLASRASLPYLDQQSFWILPQIPNRAKSARNSFTHLPPFVVALAMGVSYFFYKILKNNFFPLETFSFFCLLKPLFSLKTLQNLQQHPQGSCFALLQHSSGSHPPSPPGYRHLQLSIIFFSCALAVRLLPQYERRAGELRQAKPGKGIQWWGLLCALSAFCLVWFLRVDNRISVSSQVCQTCH